ncbi:unnamed protein product [Parnassius mnemosyne]|uniref:Uncharacterized protein n=1 Tax=Parnassius mnemosyne TaxID=213953 RepID=A0AAV1L4N3_9NEOP
MGLMKILLNANVRYVKRKLNYVVCKRCWNKCSVRCSFKRLPALPPHSACKPNSWTLVPLSNWRTLATSSTRYCAPFRTASLPTNILLLMGMSSLNIKLLQKHSHIDHINYIACNKF